MLAAVLLFAAVALFIELVVFRKSAPLAPEPTPSSPVAPALAPEPGTKQGLEDSSGRAAVDAPRAEAAALPAWASACSVTGRVVDRHAQPVAGAKISLATQRGPGAAPSVRECESNASGVFECPVEYAYSYLYSAKIVAQGFLERDLEHLRVLAPSSDLGEIVLDPGAALTGRVLDASGRPVAEARIHLVRGTDEWMNRREPGAVVASSKADGSFALEGIPSDGVRLAAEKGALRSDLSAPITMAPDRAASGIELVVVQSILVRGRVRERDTQKPLAARLHITSSPGSWVVEAQSGPDGEFSEWAGRPLSTVTCMAEAEGHTPNGTGAYVGLPESALEPLMIELTPLAAVDVVVEDEASKAPLPGAELAWIPGEIGDPRQVQPRIYAGIAACAAADAQGRIRTPAAPPMCWFAVVRAAAHAPRVFDLKELSAPGAHLQLSSGGTVRVQALAAGAPAPGVRVELYVAAESMREALRERMLPKGGRALVSAAVTDAQGEAVFNDLAPGDVTVQVHDPTHASRPIPELTVVAGQTASVTVEVGGASRIEGRITRDGAAVSGVVVVARDVDLHTRRTIESSDGPYERESAHAYTAVTKRDGRYEIEGLPAGTYDVSTLGQELGPDSMPTETATALRVVLLEGQTGVCEFELEATATLHGTVTVNGQARFGMRVVFEGSRTRENVTVRQRCVGLTDSEGHYALAVPAAIQGNLSVRESYAGGEAELAQRVKLLPSEQQSSIDFDISVGTATFEFVRNGTRILATGGSSITLRVDPGTFGVPGFPKEHRWSVGLRMSAEYGTWTLPAGSYVAFFEGGGAGHGPDCALTVREGETTSVKIETEPAK